MSEHDVGATIAAGFVVQGAIRGKGFLRIDGVVGGAVEVDGGARVGKRGRVEGGLVAADLFVEGVVEGPVHATGHVELAPGCRVRGAVRGASVKVHEGAETPGGVGLTDMASGVGFPPPSHPSRTPTQPGDDTRPTQGAAGRDMPQSGASEEPPLAPQLGRRTGRWRHLPVAETDPVGDLVDGLK